MSSIITEKADKLIEDGYAMMMTGFYNLRKAGLLTEEYDTMGTILSLLTEDRQHIRRLLASEKSTKNMQD